MLIANAAQASIRQVIVHHSFVMRDHVPGTKAESGYRHHLLSPELKAEIGRVFDQPGMYFDDGGRGYRQADQRGQTGTEPVIRQHSRVLWVVLKLDHVEVSIGAEHEMTLGATAHSADLLNRLNCHEFFRF